MNPYLRKKVKFKEIIPDKEKQQIINEQVRKINNNGEIMRS